MTPAQVVAMLPPPERRHVPAREQGSATDLLTLAAMTAV